MPRVYSYADPDARFAQRVDKFAPSPAHRPELGPCWVWLGTRTTAGYARMAINGREQYVHRWAYERFVGPIPDGFDIDHLCRNTSCVNYERHLEPVTHRVNSLRGESFMAHYARRDACSHGPRIYARQHHDQPPRWLARLPRVQPHSLPRRSPASSPTEGSGSVSFAVVRHPDITALGICPQAALESQRARGWFRVSEYRVEPAEFRLSDFEDSYEDLDAPPEPPAKPEKKTKPVVEDEEQSA